MASEVWVLTFNPDWISPPGDTIADILAERQWLSSDLAKLLSISPQQLDLLMNGEMLIDEAMATKLAKVMGSSPGFWMRREAQYRLKLG